MDREQHPVLRLTVRADQGQMVRAGRRQDVGRGGGVTQVAGVELPALAGRDPGRGEADALAGGRDVGVERIDAARNRIDDTNSDEDESAEDNSDDDKSEYNTEGHNSEMIELMI